MSKFLVVWFVPKKGVYYHRLVSGHYLEQDYSIGSKNQYGHVIVHKVENFDFYRKKVPLKQIIINKSISYLQKF